MPLLGVFSLWLLAGFTETNCFHNADGNFDKHVLETKIETEARSKFSRIFCFLDSDSNGILTKEEAAHGMARTLGTDPENFYRLWDEWSCQKFGWDDPQLFQLFISAVWLTVGRIDWSPCKMSAVSAMGVVQADMEEEVLWSQSTGEDTFVRLGFLFLHILPLLEEFYFRREMDKDGDGCLSTAEWDGYWESKKKAKFYNDYQMLIPEYSHLKEYSRQRVLRNTHENSTLHNSEENNASHDSNASCIASDDWQLWSLGLLFFSPTLTVSNSTVPQCDTLQPEQGEDIVISTIIIALASSIVICIGLCVALCRHRRNHIKLDQARQVQKLLKAKIDAWSTFDINLTARVCTLEPAFVHSLGLQGFSSDLVCLFDIVHPEDTSTLQTLLDQLKQDPNPTSIPAMATVKFLHGAIDVVNKQYTVKHVPIELLMAWGSETMATILVGLTHVGEVTCAIAVPDADLVQDMSEAYAPRGHGESVTPASAHSQGDVILNGSEVMSCGESEAATFKSMFANHHRGGQITKFEHDFKMDEFNRAFRASCLEVVTQSEHWGEVPEPANRAGATSVSTEAGQSKSGSGSAEPLSRPLSL